MTLKEYLMDYASDDTRKVGEALISEQLSKIPNPKTREIARANIEKIQSGERDFRF